MKVTTRPSGPTSQVFAASQVKEPNYWRKRVMVERYGGVLSGSEIDFQNKEEMLQEIKVLSSLLQEGNDSSRTSEDLRVKEANRVTEYWAARNGYKEAEFEVISNQEQGQDEAQEKQQQKQQQKQQDERKDRRKAAEQQREKAIAIPDPKVAATEFSKASKLLAEIDVSPNLKPSAVKSHRSTIKDILKAGPNDSRGQGQGSGRGR